MPDLYFYRDPEHIEKEEQAAAEKVGTKEGFQGRDDSSSWVHWTRPEVEDRSEGMQVPSVPTQQLPPEDWNAQPTIEDWCAAPSARPLNGQEQPLDGLKLLFYKGKQNRNEVDRK